jgi:hypothetical protein
MTRVVPRASGKGVALEDVVQEDVLDTEELGELCALLNQGGPL